MDAKQVIRCLMKETGTNMEKLAEKSGMKGVTNVTGILNRGVSLRVDKLDQLVTAMGYKIVIIPEGASVRNGWYKVDGTPGGSEKEEPEKPVSEKIRKGKKGGNQ